MKTLLAALITVGSFSALANEVQCIAQIKKGEVVEFNESIKLSTLHRGIEQGLVQAGNIIFFASVDYTAAITLQIIVGDKGYASSTASIQNNAHIESAFEDKMLSIACVK